MKKAGDEAGLVVVTDGGNNVAAVRLELDDGVAFLTVGPQPAVDHAMHPAGHPSVWAGSWYPYTPHPRPDFR